MNAPITLPLTAAPLEGWRRALPALLLLLAAIGWLYYDSFRAMVVIWDRSDTFAHCFLVPPISLWLIWRQRAALAMHTPRPSPWLLVPMAGAAFVWLLGELVAVNAATQFMATTLLILAVPAVLGWQVAKVILFPLLYLYFAVPFGEFLMPMLMQHTADFTVTALRLSGIPVYREGLQFVIPTGNWSVVEACSGVRYLMASFMVGTLFAYLNYRSWRRRVVFAIVSLLVPVLANWLRAYMIVMLGHLSGNKLAVGVDHLIYGWVFFGVIITMVFMIGARWAEAPGESPAVPLFAVGANSSPAWRPWLAGAAGALMLAWPHAALHRIAAAESNATPKLSELSVSGGWQVDPVSSDLWKPAFKNAVAESRQWFTAVDGKKVGLYIGYYVRQDEARKLISSENVLVTSHDKEWNAVNSSIATLALPTASMKVRQTVLAPVVAGGKSGVSRLVWRLYWVDGRWMHSDTEAKLAGAWQRLRGQGDDSAVLVLYADDVPERSATQALESFVRENLAMIEARLKAARHAQ